MSRLARARPGIARVERGLFILTDPYGSDQDIYDLFARSTTDGWGTSTSGHAWTIAAQAADFDVDGSQGTISVPASGTRFARIGPTTIEDAEALVKFKFDAIPSTSNLQVQCRFRITDASNHYRVNIFITPGGAMQLQAQNVIAGTPTTFGSLFTTDVGAVADSWYWWRVRFAADGSGGLNIDAKLWPDGTAEPEYTDAGRAIQRNDAVADFTAGDIGLASFNGASNSTALLTFDNLNIADNTAGDTTEPVSPGTLVFSGQNVAVTITSAVTPAALIFTGQTVSQGITNALSPGALTFSGQTVSAILGVPVSPGSLVFTGQTVDTRIAIVQTVTPGTLSFAGQSLASRIDAPVSPGALTFSGQTITTRVAVVQTVSPGALTFSGQSAAALIREAVTPGTLVFSGQTITSGVLVVNTVSPGSLTFSGQSIGARINAPVSSGSLVFSGQNVPTAVTGAGLGEVVKGTTRATGAPGPADAIGGPGASRARSSTGPTTVVEV